MPRGIPLLKKRNGAQRERRAQNQYFLHLAQKVAERKPYRILETAGDQEREITKREFENAVQFGISQSFQKILREALYTNEIALIWREMENGARFFTGNYSYRVEFLKTNKNEEKTK